MIKSFNNLLLRLPFIRDVSTVWEADHTIICGSYSPRVKNIFNNCKYDNFWNGLYSLWTIVQFPLVGQQRDCYEYG